MDDNIVLLISILITIAVGGIGSAVLIRFRSFLKNLSELIVAINFCVKDGCTSDELKKVVVEMEETVEDGLGIWSYLIKTFGR